MAKFDERVGLSEQPLQGYDHLPFNVYFYLAGEAVIVKRCASYF
jgi:hypothetical protein